MFTECGKHRTFGIIIEQDTGLRTASMSLGHASLEITEKAYVRRGHVAKGTSMVIESAIGDKNYKLWGNLWGDDDPNKNKHPSSIILRQLEGCFVP